MTAVTASSSRIGGIHPSPAAIQRRRARELRGALVAHLLGLGTGATMIIGLAPAAVSLARLLV